MGRRKLITQKELEAILKTKNPHIFFYVLSIVFLIGAIILFFVSDVEYLGCLPLMISLSSVIAALCVQPQKEEKKQELKCNSTSSTAIHPKFIQKPEYDFFTESAVIDSEYIQRLINAQRSITKSYRSPYEGLETERLLFVNYNEKTHMAKATFETTKYYRTVERYVQRNYQRTPIYSALKTKVKQYTKTYKLNNKALENLHNEFSFSQQDLYIDLIVKLNNPLFVPYHFFLLSMGEQLKIAIDYNNSLIKELEKEHKILDESNNEKIRFLLSEIEKIKNSLSKERKKADKLSAKIEKKQTPKLQNLLDDTTLTINTLVNAVNERQVEIGNLNKKIAISANFSKAKTNELKDLISDIQKRYYALLKKFKPLQADITEANEFTPLIALAGMDYTKIIGCYVIRNTENGRCYVGQSKDVIKRLKQHFKGTVPHNVIFAEDYYSAQIEDKSLLFEFKIISCETKDELDKTEKDLIEKYDAFTNGYNGTHGNS